MFQVPGPAGLCQAGTFRRDGMTHPNGNGGGVDDGSEESKVKQGLAIAPVELNLQGRNRALVGLGSYIVNAQVGCVDCHTSPTYLAGGRSRSRPGSPARPLLD